MKTGLTLITMSQGNPFAFYETLCSTEGIVDEIIWGDVCLFKEDREKILSYKDRFNLKQVKLPFNFIYKNGFSETLNTLAEYSTNNLIIYLNVSEVIGEGKDKILEKLNNKYNAYYIDHKTEKHRWWRCYDKRYLKWSGIIHEEIVGDFKPYHKPLFTFADKEKDTNDLFKAKVCNDVKEMVYWKQLMRIVDEPESLAATSVGWVQFAKDNYESMRLRLEQKGIRPAAFENEDYKSYMMDIYSNEEFAKERFDTNHIIEFQGDPKYLGK